MKAKKSSFQVSLTYLMYRFLHRIQAVNLPKGTHSSSSFLIPPCFLFSSFFSSPIMSFKNSTMCGIVVWLSFLSLLLHGCSSMHRKLLTTSFDFKELQRHRTYYSRPLTQEPDPTGDEIDLRYGVQKRLVPTGPNPLHHWSSFSYIFAILVLVVLRYM